MSIRKKTVWTAVSVVAAAAAVFAGCSRAAGTGLGIRPADLSLKEENILELYGGENTSRIFDFTAAGNLKAASVRLKILNDSGQWKDHGRVVLNSDADSGRILVTTTDEWKTVRMVVQDEEGTNSVSFQPGFEESVSQMTASSWLDEDTVIEEGEEIPLLIHVESDQNEMRTYGISAFEQPASLVGYDQVFAVTVTFSEP